MTHRTPPLEAAIVCLPTSESQLIAREIVALCAEGVIHRQREIKQHLIALVQPSNLDDAVHVVTLQTIIRAERVLHFLQELDDRFSFENARGVMRIMMEIGEMLLEILKEAKDDPSRRSLRRKK